LYSTPAENGDVIFDSSEIIAIERNSGLLSAKKVLELFPVYPFDTAAARIHARIRAELAKRGQAVGAHDLIIAATAISLSFTVVTANLRDFEKIKGLQVEQRGG